jgi:hypothetical protein
LPVTLFPKQSQVCVQVKLAEQSQAVKLREQKVVKLASSVRERDQAVAAAEQLLQQKDQATQKLLDEKDTRLDALHAQVSGWDSIDKNLGRTVTLLMCLCVMGHVHPQLCSSICRSPGVSHKMLGDGYYCAAEWCNVMSLTLMMVSL